MVNPCRIMVLGCASYSDAEALYCALNTEYRRYEDIVILHGDRQSGADLFASEWVRAAVGANWLVRSVVYGSYDRLVRAKADMCLVFSTLCEQPCGRRNDWLREHMHFDHGAARLARAARELQPQLRLPELYAEIDGKAMLVGEMSPFA